jgi:hypothetical protein
MRMRDFALALAVLGGVVYGCGGGSSSGTDGGGAKDVQTAVDSPSESSSKDVMITPEEAGEEASMMDGPAGEAGACKAVAKADCKSCCEKAHPNGHKMHTAAQLSCACEPALCGPLEGGKGFDSGALDEGACKDSCGTTTIPSPDCGKCLNTATGTKKAPGSCYTSVSTACNAEPECVAFTKCLVDCS